MTPIRLALAMGDTFTHAGAIQIFEAERDIVLIGNASDKNKALILVKQNVLDVLLLDTELPGGSLELVKNLQSLQGSPRILVLTSRDEQSFLNVMLSYGIAGYIPRTIPQREIVETVRKIAHGNSVFMCNNNTENSFIKQGDDQLTHLSKREKEVLHLISSGANNNQISRILTVAPSTVKNHITNIRQKLQIDSRPKLILWSLQNLMKRK